MQRTDIVPVDVDGTTILVEAIVHGGEEEIASGIPLSFTGAGVAVKSITKHITSALADAKPKKATVEFGCEFAVESGQLTTLLVNGSGKGSLKIILEWQKD